MKYDPKSPFIRFMTRLADLMILNIVFLVSCLPIFTVGAALTGTYYVTLKMIRNEEGRVIPAFFSSFKQNFRQSTVIWLCVLALGLLLAVDYRITGSMPEGKARSFFRVLTVLIAALSLMGLQYLFPQLARFHVGTSAAVKNAYIMAVGNLPKTVVMLVFTVGAVYVTLLNEYTLTFGVFIWIMLGFSGMAFCKSSFLVKIFDRYIPDSQNEPLEE